MVNGPSPGDPKGQNIFVSPPFPGLCLWPWISLVQTNARGPPLSAAQSIMMHLRNEQNQHSKTAWAGIGRDCAGRASWANHFTDGKTEDRPNLQRGTESDLPSQAHEPKRAKLKPGPRESRECEHGFWHFAQSHRACELHMQITKTMKKKVAISSELSLSHTHHPTMRNNAQVVAKPPLLGASRLLLLAHDVYWTIWLGMGT